MEISNFTQYNNSPSFGTAIKIVSPAKLDAIKYSFARKDVTWIDSITTGIAKDNFCGIAHDTPICYTDKIATCTAGIVTNLKKKVADMFFHLIPNEKNFENYKEFANSIPKGNNAIIIGSKGSSKCPFIIDEQPRTGEFWTKIGNSIKAKKLPVTKIGDMADEYNADMFYVGASDKLYLTFEDISRRRYVDSMDSLKKVCKQIEISPTDTIEIVK